MSRVVVLEIAGVNRNTGYAKTFRFSTDEYPDCLPLIVGDVVLSIAPNFTQEQKTTVSEITLANVSHDLDWMLDYSWHNVAMLVKVSDGGVEKTVYTGTTNRIRFDGNTVSVMSVNDATEEGIVLKLAKADGKCILTAANEEHNKLIEDGSIRKIVIQFNDGLGLSDFVDSWPVEYKMSDGKGKECIRGNIISTDPLLFEHISDAVFNKKTVSSIYDSDKLYVMQ